MYKLQQGDRVDLDYIGKGEKRDYLVLGGKISSGNNQVCFHEADLVGKSVIKILYGNGWLSSKWQLEDKGIQDIPEFHFRVLESLSEAGVKLPDYWNVISGEVNGERVDGFLQSYIGCIDIGNGGALPNVGQRDLGFIEDSHQRKYHMHEFFGDIFFDWNGFLFDIVSGKRDGESLPDFYRRIAETKL